MGKDADDALVRKIRELEEENARLRQRAGPAKQITVREDNYKGFPVLTFDGPFRPFSLGLKKLRAVHACLPQVEAFLESQRHFVAPRQEGQGTSESDSDDGRI